MKKLYSILLVLTMGITLSFGYKVKAAADPEIRIDVKGEIKKGNKIDIVVDLKNITNLYAASIDYKYDNTLLKVTEVVPSKEVTVDSTFYAYKDTDFEGNRARYAFTFIGANQMGISKDCNFITIKAEVLKDGNLDISKKNTETQLVQKKNNEIITMSHTLNVIGKVEDVIVEQGNSKGSGNISEESNKKNKDNINSSKDNLKLNEEKDNEKEEAAEEESNLEIEGDVDKEDKKDSEKNIETEDKKSNATIFVVVGMIALIILGYVSFIIIKKKKGKQ